MPGSQGAVAVNLGGVQGTGAGSANPMRTALRTAGLRTGVPWWSVSW